MTIVDCEVVLAEAAINDVCGTLRVEVIEVSRADVASPVIASSVTTGVAISAGAIVSCSLEVPAASGHQVYAVQAHLDRDGSGQTTVGDYRTMEHVALTPAMLASQDRPYVRLRRVG